MPKREFDVEVTETNGSKRESVGIIDPRTGNEAARALKLSPKQCKIAMVRGRQHDNRNVTDEHPPRRYRDINRLLRMERLKLLHPSLTAWYINRHRVVEAIGPDIVNPHHGNLSILSSLLGPDVLKWIRQHRIPSFGKLVLSDQVAAGRYFFHDARFHCCGLRARGGDRQQAKLWFPLGELDPSDGRRLELPFNSQNLTTHSAFYALQGNRHLFTCAVITDVEDEVVTARPLIVGHLVEDKHGLGGLISDAVELRATDFSAFSKIDFNVHVGLGELGLLRYVPESQVKDAFASAVNETFVEKDWGGEQADLFTARAKIRGRATNCAFAFKGPSHFHKLHPADCGKRGDQLNRLFSLPASCFVLQHCHAVSPHVRHLMRALALERLHENRRFCVIDGVETYLILKHLDALPTKQKTPKQLQTNRRSGRSAAASRRTRVCQRESLDRAGMASCH